ALIPGVLGIALLRWSPAESLENYGLDRLFGLRGARPAPPGVCIVAIDDDSYGVIQKERTTPWPRGLHARLLRTLAAEGGGVVAFDVTFLDPGSDGEGEGELSRALAEPRIGVRGASIEMTADPRFNQATVEEPYEPFAKA